MKPNSAVYHFQGQTLRKRRAVNLTDLWEQRQEKEGDRPSEAANNARKLKELNMKNIKSTGRVRNVEYQCKRRLVLIG